MKVRTEKTILLSDDSEFFRIKFSDILSSVGYRVMIVSDGKEVIEKLTSDASEIDLVVLDNQEPNNNVSGILGWIDEHNLKDKLSVLVITGAYEPEEVLAKLRELGATGLITKASTPEQLLYKVNNIVFNATIDPRIAIRAPSATPVDVTNDDKTFTGYILNLSETGAFIHYIHYMKENPPVEGENVSLRFSFVGEDRIIDAIAKVVWTDDTESSKNDLFKGFAVQFVNIQPEDKVLIGKYVKSELKKME